MPPPLDIVFFDAAWTIVEPMQSVGAIYAGAAAEFGVHADPAVLDAAFGRAWKARRAAAGSGPPYGTTEADARRFWRGVVEGAFAGAAARMPADPFFDVLYDRFATERCWRVAADALPAIEFVRAIGARVGVLSNFDSRLHGILDALGLAPRFDIVVVSCDAGSEKPDPAIFAHAMQRAGVSSPQRVGMVGDTPEDDFHGPAAAGWRACLVHRNGRPREEGVPSFGDLVQCVEHLLLP